MSKNHIQETFTNTEVGEIIHNSNWLKYASHNVTAGLEAEVFVIKHDHKVGALSQKFQCVEEHPQSLQCQFSLKHF